MYWGCLFIASWETRKCLHQFFKGKKRQRNVNNHILGDYKSEYTYTANSIFNQLLKNLWAKTATSYKCTTARQCSWEWFLFISVLAGIRSLAGFVGSMRKWFTLVKDVLFVTNWSNHHSFYNKWVRNYCTKLMMSKSAFWVLHILLSSAYIHSKR